MFAGLSALSICFIIIAIIISMTLHEAMHGYVAHWLGDSTPEDYGRLTLNPLKSIDLLTTIALPIVMILAGLFPLFAAKPVPFNPNRVKFGEFGAALVGLAGPLTNLLLAAIGGIAIRIMSISISPTLYEGIFYFVLVNVAFFVINIIPFPPLDGSRVLYAFAPDPVKEVMYRIESMGFLAILVFFLLIFTFISGPIGNIELHIVQFFLGTA